MTDPNEKQKPGPEGSDDKDTLPAAPEPDSDSELGDTDQHSKVPAPSGDRVRNAP
ncbi:MAG: hypothetical protein JHC95_11165 [Solirubrobacteraceae bacterium]|nr:hypothetical protein [Solirubrobacteraceae bacterium]